MDDSVLFLGTGGSMGIPVIGCTCTVCRSSNPKNKRLRPSILMHLQGKTFLVDVSPEFREQALKYEINRLDGVIITHVHQDHVGGLDDLRIYTLKQKMDIPLLMSDISYEELRTRFAYIFVTGGQGIVAKFHVKELQEERGETPFCGETFTYFSYSQMGLKITGIRWKDFAYVTDICKYPETIFEDLLGVKTLVISALRHTPSHLHFTVEQAIEFAQKVGADKTWFTHIAHEIDHDQTTALLPPSIELAYDGLEISLNT